MNTEKIREMLLKEARNVFETACTLRDSQRIELYLHNGIPKTSDVLDEEDAIVYSPTKILCYSAQGHDYLEEEIKAWIDQARQFAQPNPDGTPIPEPTAVEKAIRELASDLALRKGVAPLEISSFEIFANMPMDLLGSIEQEIIEYWWSAPEEENGKNLALAQIEEGLALYLKS
ncbi:MAG: hypothetical protein KU37_06715 [Sulfuricurvum sp. PC08-66]|nr:MAG: hypothetical protein KU37_06715 [Sulfuricurvum sp. PC08-66]